MTITRLPSISRRVPSGYLACDTVVAPSNTVVAPSDTATFASIANDLLLHGYSITPHALPAALANSLLSQIRQIPDSAFAKGAIGRQGNRTHDQGIRRNDILWIDDETEPQRQWLAWTALLQAHLNRTLFLGLFSFENHFSRYRPGDFYKKHYDAFKGQANRRLSVVAYLNEDWMPEDAGELIIYDNTGSDIIARVSPLFGTLAVFLSEEFPHEVLATRKYRYSITGWYRMNNSTGSHLDPPQ